MENIVPMSINSYESRLAALNRRLSLAARALEIARPRVSSPQSEAADEPELEPLMDLLLQRVGRLSVALEETFSCEADELLHQRSLLSDVFLLAVAFRTRAVAVKSRLDAAKKDLAEVRVHLTETAALD